MNIHFKRSKSGFAALIGVALAGLLTISPAKAAVIYDEVLALTSDHCSSGCGASGTIFGGVGLTQNGANVDITVHLLAGYAYAKTGSVDMQSFKFNGTGVALGDITVDAHTPALVAATGTFNGDGTGPYTFGINCPTCGGGLSGSFTNDILFHVANATIADLTHSNGISIFVADVGVTGSGGVFTGFTGSTGPIDATTSVCLNCDINQQSATTPEPASLALFGTALAGLGLLGRRRNRQNRV